MAKAKPKVSDLYDKLMEQQDRLPIPKLSDVAAAAIHEIGGVGELAKMVVVEITNAKVGSMQKARLLEMLMKGLRTDDQLPPVGQLDDKRLKAMLTRAVQEFTEIEGASSDAAIEHAGPGAEEAQGGEAEGKEANATIHTGIGPGAEAAQGGTGASREEAARNEGQAGSGPE